MRSAAAPISRWAAGQVSRSSAGIEDSPDLVYRDLTDWSLTEPNGYADYRFNDREIMRAFADNCAQTFEFLVDHGVKFVNEKPDGRAGSAHGNSVPRQMHVWARRLAAGSNRQAQSRGNAGDRPRTATA